MSCREEITFTDGTFLELVLLLVLLQQCIPVIWEMSIFNCTKSGGNGNSCSSSFHFYVIFTKHSLAAICYSLTQGKHEQPQTFLLYFVSLAVIILVYLQMGSYQVLTKKRRKEVSLLKKGTGKFCKNIFQILEVSLARN